MPSIAIEKLGSLYLLVQSAKQENKKVKAQKPELPDPGLWRAFKGGSGNRFIEALVGQVLIGGPWGLAIYGKGFSTISSWTMCPSLLKGFSSGVQVLSVLDTGEVRLWFRVQVEVNFVFSSAHALAACLAILSCYL